MTKATRGKPGKGGLTKATRGNRGMAGLTKARPPSLIARPAGHAEWLAEVKARVHAAQQRAALAANHELLRLYWGSAATSWSGRHARDGAPASSSRSPPTSARSSRR